MVVISMASLKGVLILFGSIIIIQLAAFFTASRDMNLATNALSAIFLANLIWLIVSLIKTKGHNLLRLMIGVVVVSYSAFVIWQIVEFFTQMD
jgi:hypothetical protein